MNTTTDTTAENAARLFGCDVMDSAGNKIGSIDSVWVDDATNALEFVAVKTGWFMGKNHVIPTADAQIGDTSVTVPYSEDQVKGAPSFSGDEELTADQEDDIYSYYGVQRSTAPSPTGLAAGDSSSDVATDSTSYAGGETDEADTGVAATADQAGMTLSEEQLQVGKREVEAGRVRLRKVVNTEHQEVPVELQRETVSVERISAADSSVPSDAFTEQEIEVPVMREEAVVGKEARVTGGVALNKNTQSQTETVGGEVRREDVEIDRDLETSTSGVDAPRSTRP